MSDVFGYSIERIDEVGDLEVEELREMAEDSMQSMQREVEDLEDSHLESMMEYFFTEEGLRKWVEGEDFDCSELLVAYSEDSPIGTLRFEVDGTEAELHALYVDDDYSRQGVAASLMEETHQYLEDSNVSKVRADVFEGNEPSFNLLEKFNYRKDRIDENVFEEQGGPEAVIMEREIND